MQKLRDKARIRINRRIEGSTDKKKGKKYRFSNTKRKKHKKEKKKIQEEKKSIVEKS